MTRRIPTAALWFMLAAIAAAAIAIRWWRLDLMPFRFDSAAELFRARDTLRLGGIPATGIINSLNFRNPAGFTWLLLPSALLFPGPAASAVWTGILGLSGIIPLWLACRRWTPGIPHAILACSAYAFLPWCVFGGRSIWPQNLTPAFGAWGLWLLLMAVDTAAAPRRRIIAAGLATAALAASALVHLSGVAAMLVCLGVLLAAWVRGGLPGKSWTGSAAALVVVAFALVPPLMDYASRRAGPPAPKPAHVVQFESMMPPPKGFPGRLGDAVGGIFQHYSSLGATGGIDQLITPATVAVGRTADLALLGLVGAGMAAAALRISRRRSEWQADAVLIAFAFAPPVLGAILLQRLNASYFAYALPATLLLAARLPMPRALRLAPAVIGLCAALGHGFFTVQCLRCVDEHRWINGDYYIPLGDQETMARLLAGEGITPDTLFHLSGDWFQHPYDYLLAHVVAPNAAAPKGRYALIEDIRLRGRQSARADWFAARATQRVGEVGVVFFPDRSAASAFSDEFLAIPARPAEQ